MDNQKDPNIDRAVSGCLFVYIIHCSDIILNIHLIKHSHYETYMSDFVRQRE